ncbi:MAG: hypothetical protein ABJ048_04160, partial [Balneola sp.]
MSDSYPKSKFMKIVWGFNGIALALILILAIPQAVGEYNRQFLSNSNYQENERGLIVGEKAEKAGKLDIDLQHLMYERPQKIDSTEFYYSSVIVQDKDLPQQVIDDINSAADISPYMVGARINIIFFNEDRSEVRRLLPTNGYISDVSIGSEISTYYGSDDAFYNFNLYSIALSDDNGDGRVNGNDIMPYYISNLDGTELRQITPDSLTLDSYWISDNENEIYFDRVIEDTSKPLISNG